MRIPIICTIILRFLYLFVFIGIFLSFFSCIEKPPELTMKEDKFIAMLLDVHIAEAAIQPVYEKRKDSLMTIYYDQISSMHNVDKEKFLENLRIIRKEPNLSKKIYGKVMEAFDKMEPKVKIEKKKD